MAPMAFLDDCHCPGVRPRCRHPWYLGAGSSIVERVAVRHGSMLQYAIGKTEAMVCIRGQGKQDVMRGLVASD